MRGLLTSLPSISSSSLLSSLFAESNILVLFKSDDWPQVIIIIIKLVFTASLSLNQQSHWSCKMWRKDLTDTHMCTLMGWNVLIHSYFGGKAFSVVSLKGLKISPEPPIRIFFLFTKILILKLSSQGRRRYRATFCCGWFQCDNREGGGKKCSWPRISLGCCWYRE